MRRTAALLVALAVLGAACGGGDGGAGGSASTTAGGSTSAEPATTGAAGGTATTVPTTGDGAAPGSDVLVEAEAVQLEAGAEPIDGYRIRYEIEGVTGEPVTVTGVVAVPDGDPPAGGWPIVAWAHGTTGSADTCAPSTFDSLSRQGPIVPALVAAGYVVAATDYEGLGSEGDHPYLDGDSAARSVVGSVLAAREIVPAAGERWAVAGHSQGGHSALFTAEQADELAPDLTFLGGVAIAPAAGLPFFPAVLGADTSGFLALVLVGYLAANPEVEASSLLTEVGEQAVAVARDRCILEVMTDVAQLVGEGDLLLPGVADAGTPLARYLAANDAVQQPSDGPLLVVQGTADNTVPLRLTDGTAGRLCDIGDDIDYRRYTDANHISVLPAAQADIVAWLGDRFAGTATTPTCPIPPG